MRWLAVMLVVLAAMPALSCKRPLPAADKDAAADVGPPSIVDAAVDTTVDIPADIPADAGRDAALDAAVDTVAAMCPAGAAPVDVCGCGCCGAGAMARACYYPSLGESREAIPNPIPPPSTCANAGCSYGLRHVCCGDPGPDPGPRTVCAIDTSIEDGARFTVTRRDGDVCTTLELGSLTDRLAIAGPPGYADTNAWRAPCDGSTPPVYAIGGLGRVTPGTSGTLLPFPRYDVHVVLFFDTGTGVAEAVRIDQDEVAVASRCATANCPPCGGTCTFNATYRFTTNGGNALFRDTLILAPPASYMHVRDPVTTMPASTSCAPALPVCGGAAIDASDLAAAFADPEVQDALTRSTGAATWPFYGQDQRSADAPARLLTRDGGGGFLIGAPCPAGAPTSTCMPIPAGLGRLVSLLSALDQQQLADASCASLRSPP
jgi:hypothetical protein